jgi:hypothetical protein
MILKVLVNGLSTILLYDELLVEFLVKGGVDLGGDYDYHHSTAGSQHIVLIILICICVLGLAGLLIGLNILDHL